MKYGFIKTAIAAPRVRVADPAHNVGELIRITQQAETAGVRLLVFPELCLTGATCADLFFSETLLSGAASALNEYLTATANTDLVSIVGLPVCRDSRIYDAAAVCHAGKLLGVVPRSYISARGESTMGRAFSPAPQSELTLDLCDSTVPFGKHLLFCCDTLRELCIAVETGEDLLAPCPPNRSIFERLFYFY